MNESIKPVLFICEWNENEKWKKFKKKTKNYYYFIQLSKLSGDEQNELMMLKAFFSHNEAPKKFDQNKK